MAHVTEAAREEGGEGASVGMGKNACQGDCQEDQVGVGSCAMGEGICEDNSNRRGSSANKGEG